MYFDVTPVLFRPGLGLGFICKLFNFFAPQEAARVLSFLRLGKRSFPPSLMFPAHWSHSSTTNRFLHSIRSSLRFFASSNVTSKPSATSSTGEIRDFAPVVMDNV